MPNKAKVEAVVFDLGGVLLEVDFDRVFASWAASAGVPAESIRARFSFDAAYERHERGEISAAQYFASLRDSLGLPLADAQFEQGWNQCVHGEIPGVASLVEQAARRLPLYVFSNTNAMHYQHWGPSHAALLKTFRRLFMSFQMGRRKPEAAAFKFIAAEIGVNLENILFFDDTLENVLAARALGMQVVEVRGIGDLEAGLRLIDANVDRA
ncbi:MAG: HAD family hydrolase [Burkholderiales bacterium]